MVEIIRFPNAPITEAVLEIRVRLPSKIDSAQLANFHDLVKDQYPSKRERVALQAGIHLKPEAAPEVLQSSSVSTGYFFTSSDGKQIIQARLDRFAFSRLKPYDSWKTFRNEARKLWRHYVQITSPEVITRVALRYINRIEIPLPFKDYKDYILTIPEIAPDLPQGLASFFMRLVIPEPNSQAIAIVTQTVAPIQDSSVLPLIFDIDVFREAAFDVNPDDAWNTLEALRNLKNDIFFKSITKKSKELFQ